jgi:hypothetical protein
MVNNLFLKSHLCNEISFVDVIEATNCLEWWTAFAFARPAEQRGDLFAG